MIKEYPVTFICRTCEDINKQLLGTVGFIIRDTTFDSLTDAYEHIIGNDSTYNSHRIESIIELEIP